MSQQNEQIEKYYSVEQAAEKAVKWCQKHPGWQRICDIEDTDKLYKTWEELPKYIRRAWDKEFPYCAEEAWREFGVAPCKVPYGFISGAGKFYKKAKDVPRLHNFVMIFKIKI